jgi:hypothetical protein
MEEGKALNSPVANRDKKIPILSYHDLRLAN